MRIFFPAIFLLAAGLAGPALAADELEFRFEKPEAQTVDLMAEFNQWKAQPMRKQADGTWTVKVSVPPGTYGYKFLVNGTDWQFDPKNPNRKTVDGIENSTIEIGGAPSPAAAAAGTPSSVTAQSTPSSPVSNASSLAPVPGEVLSLEVPLSPKRRAEAAQKGSPQITQAKMAIAVPPGFDPQKTWPILVINNTEAYPNIDSMNQFKETALNSGWVIMAADPLDAEKSKDGDWRWPTVAAAMDYVAGAWPGAADWPIAVGGMSGGGKNSAFIAADFARDRHRVIGLLMMGCNQDMASVAYRKSAPPNFLFVPVFLSSGKSDTIATPAQHEYVKSSLRGTGFQKVRLESFDGAHDIYQPHVAEALQWFLAQAPPAAAQKSASDFDKFFHKP